MSDTNAPPPEDKGPVPDARPALPAPAGAPRRRSRDPVPLLYAGGFVALAIAVVWLWTRPVPQPTPGVDPARVAALETRLGQMEPRVAQLEPRLAPLDRRIAALEQRPAPDAPPPPPDLAPLERRLSTALDRIAALEERPAGQTLPLDDLAARRDLAALAARQDTIASRQDALAARQQQAENEFTARVTGAERSLTDRIAAAERTLSDRLAALETRLAAAEQVASRLPQVEDRAARLARLATAQAALDAGQPLGTIPGAPPELARFATAAPPTEASLRLAFPAAARAAREAAGPDTSGQGVLESAWNRAQALVTVRRGEEVVVGDPAAGTLATARRALEAGDLAGAVATLGRLPPQAAAAMEGWTGQARALLAARAALARLAA